MQLLGLGVHFVLLASKWMDSSSITAKEGRRKHFEGPRWEWEVKEVSDALCPEQECRRGRSSGGENEPVRTATGMGMGSIARCSRSRTLGGHGTC